MLGVMKTLIFLILQIILVQCFIPSLTVRKLDQKFIQRKRQDTLEMCRIFSAESDKLKTNSVPHGSRRRVRREIETSNSDYSTLKRKDDERVEKIVDKLYDDVSENGAKMAYRHREILSATVKNEAQKPLNGSARRFNFAPAELLGSPLGKDRNPAQQPSETVPRQNWIKIWKHGIVPFFIDPRTYDNHLAEVIIKAFDYFEKATCIRLQRLREKPNDQESMSDVEWVYVSNPAGIRQCVHSNERLPNKGVQMVVLGYDCMSVGEIVHEVMHILGFSHEHTRPDRDQHITVQWDNIKPGYKKYFTVRPEDELQQLPYDHASVLHYPSRAFSKNGQVTLAAKDGIKLGQREGLSETDVEKVSLVFGNECVDRNKDYLLATCPSVIKATPKSKPASEKEIEDYFKDRLWPYGIVNYKFRDAMEFSIEERENLLAVFKHIEKETCIQFHDMTTEETNAEDNDNTENNNNEPKNNNEGNIISGNNNNNNGDGVVELHEANNNDKGAAESINEPNRNDNHNIVETTNNIDDGKEAGNVIGNSKDNNVESKAENNSILQTSDGRQIILNPADTDALKINASYHHLRTNATFVRSASPDKRVKRSVYSAPSAKRRHADNTLILTRSNAQGCKCPRPGKSGANQILELSADCFNSVNDLLHVFVHVLGLDHQHNMHDRDEYLHIVWDKMTPGVEMDMTVKLPPAAAVGFPYDYQSVMHYPWLQIKAGAKSIIYPIWNDGWVMGHWQGLSTTDVQKLIKLYFDQCTERNKHADANNN